jgi:heat shock protein 5
VAYPTAGILQLASANVRCLFSLGIYSYYPQFVFSATIVSLNSEDFLPSLVTSYFFTMARTWTWLRAINISVALLMAILFMGMVANANAEETEAKDNGITGPGQFKKHVRSLSSARFTNTSIIVIGIDLGTTYSCVGIMKGGTVEILVNDQGNRITPSWVAWNDEERLVGDAAKNQFAANPHRTVFDIKRMIGRKYDDKDVQKDMKHFPFKVVNKNGQPRVKVDVGG